MSVELKHSVHANNYDYWVTYYCYKSKCPGRTEERPWPTSCGTKKWTNVISKKGTTYRRKKWFCNHCGEEMSGTVSANDFA